MHSWCDGMSWCRCKCEKDGGGCDGNRSGSGPDPDNDPHHLVWKGSGENFKLRF